MAMTIGYIENNIKVKIAASSPNEHLAIWGISGSGKSTRISKIVEEIVSTGGTVIAFDLAGQDYKNLKSRQCRISAQADGIDLQILDTTLLDLGAESYVNFISYIVDVFTDVYQLGVRQQGALRDAVAFAIQNKHRFSSEMEAIEVGLIGQKTAVAQGVANKLWQVLNCGIFRKSEKKFTNQSVNILSFEGINPSAQRELAEIILAFIWRKIRLEGCSRNICLVIDEFQNFVKSKRSILLEMLRESRKYGVNIILSTQTSGGISQNVLSSISQTAVQLYFRPPVQDTKKIAALISEDRTGYWVIKLNDLKLGESVAIGNMSVNGRAMSGPIIIRTMKQKEYSDSTHLMLTV
ncbi:ATP-binding protein [Faecalicatena contorta]|uniref:ATP-binding protein n=1 Tax=Faecalicatena contorta TaxID=39482 RepID=UPI001F4504A0|nr:DUF87 domain-containing protein [Faecalicatena contorta]MCF2554409.1 ATP-binding protein [Faecalicatena contorta]